MHSWPTPHSLFFPGRMPSSRRRDRTALASSREECWKLEANCRAVEPKGRGLKGVQQVLIVVIACLTSRCPRQHRPERGGRSIGSSGRTVGETAFALLLQPISQVTQTCYALHLAAPHTLVARD